MKTTLLALAALTTLALTACENLQSQPTDESLNRGAIPPGDIGSDYDTAPITGGGARPPRTY